MATGSNARRRSDARLDVRHDLVRFRHVTCVSSQRGLSGMSRRISQVKRMIDPTTAE